MNRMIVLATLFLVSGCVHQNRQHEVVEFGAAADPNVQRFEFPDATVSLRVRENRWPAFGTEQTADIYVDIQIWDDQVRYSEQAHSCNAKAGCAKCSGCCIGSETSATIWPRTEPIMTKTSTSGPFVEGFGESNRGMIWMMPPTRHIIRSAARLLVWLDTDQISCVDLGEMERRDRRVYRDQFLSQYDLWGPQSQFMMHLFQKLRVGNYVTWQAALRARTVVYRYINAKLGCIVDKTARDEALRNGDALLAGYGAVKI